MSDLLKRLRHHEFHGENDSWLQDLCGDAADEIERLRTAPEPSSPEQEWPLLTRIKADIAANAEHDQWTTSDEQHCATLDLLHEAMKALQKRASDEPPADHSNCPFCDQPCDDTGSIWHRPHCEGLQDAGITKIRLHFLMKRAAQPPPVNEDSARLDYLDELNRKANERANSSYGWRLDINHNRVALADCHPPGLSAREAIDAHRSGVDPYHFRRSTLTKGDEQP